MKIKTRTKLILEKQLKFITLQIHVIIIVILNEVSLKYMKLIERKTIDNGSEDYEGCDYTAAFVFKKESIGETHIKSYNGLK